MGRIQRTKVFKLVAVLLVIVMIITSIPVLPHWQTEQYGILLPPHSLHAEY